FISCRTFSGEAYWPIDQATQLSTISFRSAQFMRNSAYKPASNDVEQTVAVEFE
ncbi:unnamed protein product, partial [Ceratitis capitata]